MMHIDESGCHFISYLRIHILDHDGGLLLPSFVGLDFLTIFTSLTNFACVERTEKLTSIPFLRC